MRVTIEVEPDNRSIWINYPFLARNKKYHDLIVLAVEKGKNNPETAFRGIALTNAQDIKTGEVHDWDYEVFELYNGPVTLENEPL